MGFERNTPFSDAARMILTGSGYIPAVYVTVLVSEVYCDSACESSRLNVWISAFFWRYENVRRVYSSSREDLRSFRRDKDSFRSSSSASSACIS